MVAWVWVALAAGAFGGMVAHLQRSGELALPVWLRQTRALRLGVLRDVLIGAAAGPVAAYFAVTAAGATPGTGSALFFGLLGGFGGAPVLTRLVEDRLRAHVRELRRQESELAQGAAGDIVEGGEAGGSRAGSER